MQKFTLLLGLCFSMLTVSCMEPAELIYSLDFEAEDPQRMVIAQAFLNWSEATGVMAYEAQDPGDARVVFREGTPPPGQYGQADYQGKDYFDAASLRTITYLNSATVLLKSAVWDLDPTDQFKFFTHEIGHIMIAGDHSEECPSTMNPDFYSCGSDSIDAASREQGLRKIDEGWLWLPTEPGL